MGPQGDGSIPSYANARNNGTVVLSLTSAGNLPGSGFVIVSSPTFAILDIFGRFQYSGPSEVFCLRALASFGPISGTGANALLRILVNGAPVCTNLVGLLSTVQASAGSTEVFLTLNSSDVIQAAVSLDQPGSVPTNVQGLTLSITQVS